MGRAAAGHDDAVGFLGLDPRFDYHGLVGRIQGRRVQDLDHSSGSSTCRLRFQRHLVGAEQLMLQRSGPSVVLRLSPEAIHVLVVEHQDTAGRSELAGLVIASVSAGKAATIDPVRAVEPIAVDEPVEGSE